MKHIFKLAVAALAAFAVIAAIQQADPVQALKDINDTRAKRMNEVRIAGSQAEFDAIQKETLEKAKAAVKGVDPAKVDPKLGFTWATLFSMAEMHKEACDAATRFLTSNPDPSLKFNAQMLMMRSCSALGEGNMLAMMIGEITPPDANGAISLAMMTGSVYADTINGKMGLDAAMKALDKVELSLPRASTLDEKTTPRLYATISSLATTRAELLQSGGRETEAVYALDKALSGIPEKDPNVRMLRSAKARIVMMNKPAPALSVERAHGTFNGLEGLKGKVVILDFFAHWCGPCIRSFPDMKKLYSDLKPKGLEIVGVTTYYGYYKKENSEKRDMTRDTEFAKMGEFIKEYELPWPVAYGERANFESYGITGIPHVAVLDRKGIVHKIKIGYSPELFVKFRDEIEKLINAHG